MRWLFLLLIVLNIFYYVWHQQEAPLKAKDVTPLALYRGAQQDIHLLSESGVGGATTTGKVSAARVPSANCLYVGGVLQKAQLGLVQARLFDLGVKVQSVQLEGSESEGLWLMVRPESRDLLGGVVLDDLSKEFNELKHKIMPCEGIASDE